MSGPRLGALSNNRWSGGYVMEHSTGSTYLLNLDDAVDNVALAVEQLEPDDVTRLQFRPQTNVLVERRLVNGQTRDSNSQEVVHIRRPWS